MNKDSRWLLVDVENRRVYNADGLIDGLIDASDKSDLNGNIDFTGYSTNINHELIGVIANSEGTATGNPSNLRALSWNLHSMGEAFKSIQEEQVTVKVHSDEVKLIIEIIDNL